MKVLIIIFFATLIIFSCQKRTENVYTEILHSQLDDSKKFLIKNINEYESAIEIKITDFPYLKKSHDSLKKLNIKIDKIISQSVTIEINKSRIKHLKKDLEKDLKQSFDFKSLTLENNFDKTLRVKIIELDFLKAKQRINENYFKKYCNIVH